MIRTQDLKISKNFANELDENPNNRVESRNILVSKPLPNSIIKTSWENIRCSPNKFG
jgi:hypothetical protein